MADPQYPENPGTIYEVCPFCHREVTGHVWTYGNDRAEAWTCPEHGHVVPMKSAVKREDTK